MSLPFSAVECMDTSAEHLRPDRNLSLYILHSVVTYFLDLRFRHDPIACHNQIAEDSAQSLPFSETSFRYGPWRDGPW